MPEALLDLAVRAAEEAARVLLPRSQEPARNLEAKSSPTDPVSEADRTAEEHILKVIRHERPGDGILAEEGGGAKSTTGVRWVVDPLDGTVNFLYGIPAWAISIAVEDDQGGLAAVILDPSRGERFTAARGRGARLNGTPVHVSEPGSLEQSLVATGFAYKAEIRTRQAARLVPLLGRVRDIRRGGSAALDQAWVACGRLDAYFEAPLMPWDMAAGTLLVREAGGVVSEISSPSSGRHGLLAAPPAIHTQLLGLLSQDA